MEKIKNIIDMAYHRNGICGVPFIVTIFESADGNNMVGIRFDDDSDCYCAVLDIDKLAEHEIRFCHNSWRGDHFADEILHAWVKSDNH